MKHLALPLLLTAAAVAAGCRSGAETTPAAPATPVRVAQASNGPAFPTVEVHGVIGSRDEMRLAFKVGGVIRRFTVNAGDSVRAGQMLAQIDLAEIDAQLAQARELDTKAARDLERGERLNADQVISLEQLQNLRTQREVAAAQFVAARFNRAHASISAAADGVVLQRLAQEHELVPAGQPVLIVSSAARGYVVRAAVSDRELLQIHIGDPAMVRLDALPGRELSGSVSERGGAADPATGLFPIEVRLVPADVTLASGLVASLRLQPTATGASLARIPAGAIVEADGGRASVFVLDGDRARRRDVQIAFLDGDQVALRAGLNPGERVITDGAAFLDEGERVAVASR
jgi:multidrug efflux system membrane fusion protein